MRIESLTIGMTVRHPQYGLGTVKALTEHMCDVVFTDGRRTLDPVASELAPAAAQANIQSLEIPLHTLIQQTCEAMVHALGLEKPDTVIEDLAARWHHGKVVLHPADPALQTKEIPLEVFFHKIVMVRNNLRVLEQKINAHDKLSEADKIEMQQYITRSYGSFTTLNLLFKDKAGYF